VNTAGTAPFSWRAWWPIFAGLAAVLLVTYVRFWNTAWATGDSEHAPVLVAIALFLFWRERGALREAVPPASALAPVSLLVLGALLYLLGARTKIAPLEAIAHIPLVAGAIWMVGGPRLVVRFWFPIFFLAISIPLPAFVVGQATASLKTFVSQQAADLLYTLGYPVARDGVIITVGPYQLLVAEACAGMNSIISLSAVGLLYLYLVPPRSVWRLGVLLAIIVPIAIAANIVRIVLLSLITYHLGDEAGQGFLHEFAGIAMFGFALATFLLASFLLEQKFGWHWKRGQGA